MAYQPTDSRGGAPDAPGAITLGTRASDRVNESADLLMGDAFGPAANTAQPGQASTLSVRMLLRHKWLMAASFILVAGVCVPCSWLLPVPLYESTALVRVEPVVPRIVFNTENNGMLPLYREYMNTQVSAIRSPKVLERVLDRKNIQETHWYREEGKRLMRDALSPLERLAKTLDVQTRPNTQLISVSISTERGNEAKLIVDTTVDEYYKAVKEREQQENLELIGKVREQHTALESEIKGLRELRKSLSRDSGLMDSLELRTQLSTKLDDLESNYMEVDRDLKLLGSRLERSTAQATQPAAGKEGTPTQSGPDYAVDAEWRGLNLAVKNVRHELDLARGEYGEAHPKIKQMTSNVTHAESLLAERESQLKEQWGRPAVAQTNPSNSQMASISPEAIKQQILPEKQLEKELLQKDIDKLRGKVTDIAAITRNEEQLRDKQQIFATVRDRLTTLETESKAPGRITIDSYGFGSSEPGKDRRPLLTVMSLGGAVMVALALAYLRGMSDSRIHEAGDIQHIGQAPFLGRLTLLPKKIVPKELGGPWDRSLLVAAPRNSSMNSYPDPYGPLALMEGVRMVRTALLERLGGTTAERAVLITSPTAGAGKTSVALLLARSIAVTGKKVLLVECDFYRPSLSGRLGLKAGAGLAALLSRDVDDAHAIQQRIGMPFLDVLPLGDLHEAFNPEVLANGVFSECVARWKQSYDFVILDSSPVLLVADARILASHADGTILVVRASHNRRMETWTAFEQLAATRGGVLGVVLIGGETPSAYHYYGYADYAYAATPTASGADGASRDEVTTSPDA
jgi:succinoglycan biosynthesis transport protein ExoP